MHKKITFNEAELLKCIDKIDDTYEEEKRVFSDGVRKILARSGRVTSRDLLFYFIAEIEITTDIVRLDVLRTCLEILMGLKGPLKTF